MEQSVSVANYVNEMAQTIYQSLFWSIDKAVFSSWGAEKLKATLYKKMPALQFHVMGMIHTGYVVITYDEGPDLFNLYLLNEHQKCIKSIEGVYADEIGRKVDEEVERAPGISDKEYQARLAKLTKKAG